VRQFLKQDKQQMINWQEIDTVLLDMDGTLLDLHFDNYFWLTHLPTRYAEFHGVDLVDAQNKLEALIDKYRGTLQWYCLDHWSELIKMDMVALKREVSHKIATRPYAEDFLKALQAQGKKLVLITNAHPGGLEIKLECTRIDRWLDIVISSNEFQSPKEEQSFWQQLHAREHFDVQRTLFIDDTARILRSAQNFGIKHLVCVTQPDTQKAPESSGEFIDIQHFDEIMPSSQRP